MCAQTEIGMVRPPDRHLLNVLASYDNPVAALVLALREILLEEAPDAQERMYSNDPSAVWFGSGPKMKDMFCYIAAARSHVNLGFCRGASLADPNRVFEGECKMMRHIKFRSERLGTSIRTALHSSGNTLDQS